MMPTSTASYRITNTHSKPSRKRSRSYPRSQSKSKIGASSARPEPSSEKLVDSSKSFAYNSPNTSARIGTHDVTLRVVHLSDVLLHEHTEQDRFEKLVERFQSDHLLKNPPIVTPDDAKY